MRQLPSAKFWPNLSNATLLNILLLFGCGWALMLLINYFYTVIAIFTTAGIFAALVNYPVAWLSRYLPRPGAIALTFTIAVVTLVGAVTLLGLEVINQGQGLLDQLTGTWNHESLLPFRNFLEEIDMNKIVATLQSGLASGLSIAQSLFSSAFTGIFTLVISVYMVIDGDKLWRLFLQLVPAPSRDRFAQTFQRSFLGFLRGQLLLMLFLSVASFLAFSLLGVRYALILAVIIGVLDAIPGIGATLGVVIVTLLVLASQGGAIALPVVITSILLQQIQDNIIHPKVMGDALELNPVLLFLALFIGERIAGLLGVFLAIPLAGMIAAWVRSVQAEAETLDQSPLS
jgi:predicted PurR-regulated permease PerM